MIQLWAKKERLYLYYLQDQFINYIVAQSPGAVEYTDCTSAEG